MISPLTDKNPKILTIIMLKNNPVQIKNTKLTKISLFYLKISK